MGTKMLSTPQKNTSSKINLDYMQASTLNKLLSMVNIYNNESSNNPILKDDIVDIVKEEGSYILLYYK